MKAAERFRPSWPERWRQERCCSLFPRYHSFSAGVDKNGRRRQADETYQESVFDQVLALFVLEEAAQSTHDSIFAESTVEPQDDIWLWTGSSTVMVRFEVSHSFVCRRADAGADCMRYATMGLTGSGIQVKMKVSLQAGVTQLVECDLAKVDVAGSNPVSRSSHPFQLPLIA